MGRLRRFFSRISIRLLAFNVLLVFLPASGVHYLDALERLLLEAQERVMVQQGRVLAAALSERGVLKAAYAEGILVRLRQQTEARMRVVDPDGRVLADSATLGPLKAPRPPGETGESGAPATETRANPAYRLGAVFVQAYQRFIEPSPPLPELDGEDAPSSPQILASPEIREALSGRYGARTRSSPGGVRSLTLVSALPIWDGDQVVGAVQVSQSTFRVLNAIYPIRLGIFRVFLASVGLAAVLSLVVSGTIARPLRRLRDEATALLDRRGRIKGRFGGSRRRDEIGELSRSLQELSRRLEDHVRFIESFAADLSHELRNPLASIRSATEVAAEVESREERERFKRIVEREVARIEHLLGGARELAQLDARLETEARHPVDLRELLTAIVEGYRLRRSNVANVANVASVASVALDMALGTEPLLIVASSDRLTQVFENLLDNAISFSPPDGRVAIQLTRAHKVANVAILDGGPGIPQGSEAAIFSRFYTYRPGTTKSAESHTGLGLSLVKAIVEGYGGTVEASNRLEGGAVFVVKVPLA